MKKGSYVDITGKRFGRYTVIEYAYNKNRKAYWKCKCDCGNERIVHGAKLRSGHVKSCGCLVSIVSHEVSKTHGDSRSRLYNVWISMKDRCCDSTCQAFPNYGGRGIRICDEWVNDYFSFREWALNNGYADNLSIDRVDVNGNYEPSNCKWSTQKEQARNRRNTIYVTYHGEEKTLAEWCEVLQLPYEAMRRRIRNKHWNAEMAFNTPLRG